MGIPSLGRLGRLFLWDLVTLSLAVWWRAVAARPGVGPRGLGGAPGWDPPHPAGDHKPVSSYQCNMELTPPSVWRRAVPIHMGEGTRGLGGPLTRDYRLWGGDPRSSPLRLGLVVGGHLHTGGLVPRDWLPAAGPLGDCRRATASEHPVASYVAERPAVLVRAVRIQPARRRCLMLGG